MGLHSLRAFAAGWLRGSDDRGELHELPTIGQGIALRSGAVCVTLALTILILGDSLSAPGSAPEPWPAQLEANVINLAVPGVDTGYFAPPWLPPELDFDLAIVMLGTNDFFRGDTDYDSNLRGLTATLLTTPSVSVLLVTPPHPHNVAHVPGNTIELIGDVMADLCAESPRVTCGPDLATLGPWLFADGVHFTQEGHDRVAYLVRPFVIPEPNQVLMQALALGVLVWYRRG